MKGRSYFWTEDDDLVWVLTLISRWRSNTLIYREPQRAALPLVSEIQDKTGTIPSCDISASNRLTPTTTHSLHVLNSVYVARQQLRHSSS